MYMTQPFKAINWHRKSSNLPEIFWVKLWRTLSFSSPEAIVLFSGLAKSGDYIMKPIQESIDRNILNIYKGKTKLLVSELKDSDAAVLGASALAWELKDLKE